MSSHPAITPSTADPAPAKPGPGATTTLHASVPPPANRALAPSLPPPDADVVAYRAPASNEWRFIRAYSTTFQVIGSYVWLSIKSRLFGKAYREARITDVHKRNARRVGYPGDRGIGIAQPTHHIGRGLEKPLPDSLIALAARQFAD